MKKIVTLFLLLLLSYCKNDDKVSRGECRLQAEIIFAHTYTETKLRDTGLLLYLLCMDEASNANP